ncbi:MAG: tetratricopeptide repeat protein [Kofleriaceae bacterium]
MRRTLACSVAVAALVASTAIAQPHPDADAHARRGVALYNLGKYEDSIEAFESAYTLFQSDALLFNLAQAHRQLEHCELAVTYYKRFLAGAPSPELATQVESLLPKLEAACRTKFERPAGTVVAASAPAAAPEEPAVTARAEPPASRAPIVLASAGITAGTVISGKTAPTAGVKASVTTPLALLRGSDVGVAIGAGHMWRSESDHDATVAQLAATIRWGASFDWGRFTVATEVGAAYFSSLDTSSGVVPRLTRAAQGAPLVRGEVGGEHDLTDSLALRVAVALGLCPRTGQLLNSVGQLDLIVGLRYAR